MTASPGALPLRPPLFGQDPPCKAGRMSLREIARFTDVYEADLAAAFLEMRLGRVRQATR